MHHLTILQNSFELVDQKPLDLILTEIKTGYYRDEIENLRSHLRYGRIGHYQNQKMQLLKFIPAGIFKIQSNFLVLYQYSYYILLDTGPLSPQEILVASSLLKRDPHTLSYFLSPSGSSLKIIVEVNLNWAYYQESFLAVKEYFQKIISVPVINSERQITQMCYYSWDPDLYHNPNHKILQVLRPEY